MLKLKCLASGSSGNCYLLESETETLILDAGIPIKDIKRGLGWDIKRIAGVVASHGHGDHIKAVKDFEDMGIDVWQPYKSQEIERKSRKFGNFTVSPLPMLDKEMKVWQHSNADKSECPCYGFYITHPEMGKMVYITDTKCIVWNFSKQKLNHILISANYDQRLSCDDEAKRSHVLTGHLSIQEACRWIDVNNSNALRNVILCHLSSENIDQIEAQAEAQKVANCPVYVAEKGLEVELKESECPF